jgi:hypothetical protein
MGISPGYIGPSAYSLVDILKGVFYTVDKTVSGEPGRLSLMYLIHIIRENPSHVYPPASPGCQS